MRYFDKTSFTNQCKQVMFSKQILATSTSGSVVRVWQENDNGTPLVKLVFFENYRKIFNSKENEFKI